jgi:hypothetical protein
MRGAKVLSPVGEVLRHTDRKADGGNDGQELLSVLRITPQAA